MVKMILEMAFEISSGTIWFQVQNCMEIRFAKDEDGNGTRCFGNIGTIR